LNFIEKVHQEGKRKREIPFPEGIFFSGLAWTSRPICYWAGRKKGVTGLKASALAAGASSGSHSHT
jgi:hypothetical protein